MFQRKFLMESLNHQKIGIRGVFIGEELDFLVVDKYNFKFFGTAQDHKRVGENDKGPNTGDGSIFASTNNKFRNRKKVINKMLNQLESFKR